MESCGPLVDGTRMQSVDEGRRILSCGKIWVVALLDALFCILYPVSGVEVRNGWSRVMCSIGVTWYLRTKYSDMSGSRASHEPASSGQGYPPCTETAQCRVKARLSGMVRDGARPNLRAMTFSHSTPPLDYSLFSSRSTVQHDGSASPSVTLVGTLQHVLSARWLKPSFSLLGKWPKEASARRVEARNGEGGADPCFGPLCGWRGLRNW